MSEKGGINYLFILIIIIFTVGLATGSTYFMLTRVGIIDGTVAQQETTGGESARDLGPVTYLDEFTINLAEDRRFVRVSIALEVNDSDVVEEIETRNPQIRDVVISIVRAKGYDDITNEDGTRALRGEIRDEINSKLSEGRVTNVFFTEFMIQ